MRSWSIRFTWMKIMLGRIKGGLSSRLIYFLHATSKMNIFFNCVRKKPRSRHFPCLKSYFMLYFMHISGCKHASIIKNCSIKSMWNWSHTSSQMNFWCQFGNVYFFGLLGVHLNILCGKIIAVLTVLNTFEREIQMQDHDSWPKNLLSTSKA